MLLTNAKTGDLDAMYSIAGKDVAAVKSGNELVYKDAPGIGFSSFQFNAAKDPLTRRSCGRRSRRRWTATRSSRPSTSVSAGRPGPIQPSSWAYDPNFKPYGGNVDKAKEYLKAGGSPGGFPCELQIASGSADHDANSPNCIKDQMAKVGIIVTIKQEEGATQSADQMSGNFQIVPFGWSGRIDPDGNIYNNFHTGGGLNYGKYSNPQADDLMEKARAAGDQAQRRTSISRRRN